MSTQNLPKEAVLTRQLINETWLAPLMRQSAEERLRVFTGLTSSDPDPWLEHAGSPFQRIDAGFIAILTSMRDSAGVDLTLLARAVDLDFELDPWIEYFSYIMATPEGRLRRLFWPSVSAAPHVFAAQSWARHSKDAELRPAIVPEYHGLPLTPFVMGSPWILAMHQCDSDHGVHRWIHRGYLPAEVLSGPQEVEDQWRETYSLLVTSALQVTGWKPAGGWEGTSPRTNLGQQTSLELFRDGELLQLALRQSETYARPEEIEVQSRLWGYHDEAEYQKPREERILTVSSDPFSAPAGG